MVLATSVKHTEVSIASFDSKNSRAYCESLAAKLKTSDLPASCRQILQTDEAKVDPFMGMKPGQAIASRKSLKEGRESQVQLTRKWTNGGSRFSKNNN